MTDDQSASAAGVGSGGCPGTGFHSMGAVGITAAEAPISPLSWQHEPIEVLADVIQRRWSGLDASDTGIGKTMHALFAIKAAGMRAAIICPRGVVPSWQEAAAKVGVDLVFCMNIERLKMSPVLKRYGKTWKWTPLPRDTVLVFDEVHRFSGADTANGRILAYAPRPLLMLSATAAVDPTKMRAIGHQLGLFEYGLWVYWCGEHGCTVGRFGGMRFSGSPEILNRIHKQIYDAGNGVRVRIADLGDKFPSVQFEAVSVPVEKAEIMDEARMAALQALADEATNAMEVMLRERQISEHQKLPAEVEMAEDWLAQDIAPVIFVNFRDSMDRIRSAFPEFSYLHGDLTDSERSDQIDKFQANETPGMVAMLQCGGTGLNLQDLHGRRRGELLNWSWSATDVRQAVGRIHRAKSKSPALIRFIFAQGTIEERVRRQVETKFSCIDALNDGDLAA